MQGLLFTVLGHDDQDHHEQQRAARDGEGAREGVVVDAPEVDHVDVHADRRDQLLHLVERILDCNPQGHAKNKNTIRNRKRHGSACNLILSVATAIIVVRLLFARSVLQPYYTHFDIT